MSKPKSLSEIYYEYERDRLESARKIFAEKVVRPIVDRMIEDGVLPKGTFSIVWDSESQVIEVESTAT